jgi:hypothetical protein
LGRRPSSEDERPGMCVGRIFHELGLQKNPPSPRDIQRIGERHEALKATASLRPLLPEETEHLYVLDALQKEFQLLATIMDRETAALRAVDEELRFLTTELEHCHQNPTQCPAAERTRITKRLETLWDERRKRSLSWTDILKLQAIPVVTCLLKVVSITATSGGLTAVIGSTTGLVAAIAMVQRNTTELVAEAGKWKPLLTGLGAVGVAVGGAAAFTLASPLAIAGAVGSAALFVGANVWSAVSASDGPVTAAASQKAP